MTFASVNAFPSAKYISDQTETISSTYESERISAKLLPRIGAKTKPRIGAKLLPRIGAKMLPKICAQCCQDSVQNVTAILSKIVTVILVQNVAKNLCEHVTVGSRIFAKMLLMIM